MAGWLTGWLGGKGLKATAGAQFDGEAAPSCLDGGEVRGHVQPQILGPGGGGTGGQEGRIFEGMGGEGSGYGGV